MSGLPTLRDQDWLSAGPVTAIFAILNMDGDEGRAVGGAVRDSLMGREVRDVDFATTATPDIVTARAEAAGIKAVPTGIDHGTVTLVSHGIGHEVTTLREDVETDGRHAIVRFGRDWRADAARRDFTMNALSVEADGTIHDPIGGYQDAIAHRVRFIGDPDRRIAEDRLRVLRFFRFHAQCGAGDLDPAGLAAAIRARAGLLDLAAERLNHELRKLLVADGAVATVATMRDGDILQLLLGGEGDPARLARVAAFEDAAGLDRSFARRLAALGAMDAKDAQRLAERLKLSNADRDAISAAIVNAERYPDTPTIETAQAEIYRLGRDIFADALALAAAAGTDSIAARVRPLVALRGWTVPEFPISGKDLLALGVQKGPVIGMLLRNLEAWWIAGGFAPDREALLARVQQIHAGQQ